MTATAVSLDDKYTLEQGRVFMTGMQALVRLPMLQKRRDERAGLNTAGFISGYRGSPLGNYDASLWNAAAFLKKHHIHFQPGVNEDLAATAVWGSQQVNLQPSARYDGVFAIWYGKGPGVDRSGDAIKHLNYAGSSRHGGVLLMAGDDHGCKSSTLPHQSEPAFVAANVPVLNPANVQEYLDYGLYGFAMSRYAGVAVGFKCVGDTVESSATVDIDPDRVSVKIPTDFTLPPDGLNIRYPDAPVMLEERLIKWKLPAAQAFVRANGLDRIVIDSPAPKLGIATSGKAYMDVRQALEELGIGDSEAAALGLRVYKIAMVWPLEPEGARAFADGLEEIVVFEEKRGLIESQLKTLLFNQSESLKRIVGKTDETGALLLPEYGELSPGKIAGVLVDRLRRYHERPEFEQRLARLEQIEAQAAGAATDLARTPYFCSGCPHNTSTKLPDGSRAMAGIGCHGMALWMPERRTETITHMGGEGVNWIGQAPFSNDKHVFQNLGDGTYFHSGLMAIRAAAAANVNITYKILYNDAVAMTGGQPHDGDVSPPEISRQVHAEGAKKIAVVTDEPEKYPLGTGWAPGVSVHHRDELDQVQRELREIAGVTILIYDQTCAAEKRRRRKRGLFPDPDKRVFINDLVCEGCGDCSKASNCVSVQPVETPLGRKRRIDQSNCNKDFSCLNGFCPSFVTVHGASLRKSGSGAPDRGPAPAETTVDLPLPALPPASEPYGILITGIGGTGVVTIGALLGMAAHIDGKAVSVLDQTGLAQKNGAVTSHVRIAERSDDLHATRIAAGGAKLFLGCDIVVAAAPESLLCASQGVTSAVVNDHMVPTAAFLQNQQIDLSSDALKRNLTEATGDTLAHFLNATRLATALLGDSIATNLFMVGYAFQKGLIPLSLDAIVRAVELNGTAVAFNKQALNWGRLAAHDMATVETAAQPVKLVAANDAPATPERDLKAIVARRADYLTQYQDSAYADRYRRFVERAAKAEQEAAKGQSDFAKIVARNLFKLMAYKDEYEVARLHSDPAFMQKLQQQFAGDFKLSFHLAPPLMSATDPATGLPKKREFGGWMLPVFRVLAGFKALRGHALDPFGWTGERRMERRLITEYEAAIETVMDGMNRDNHSLACLIAELPEQIRGFGHVKKASVDAVKAEEQRLLDDYRNPAVKANAAAAE